MKHKLFFLATFLLLVFTGSASWAANSNLIGGDRDSKGCIRSAGYVWSYLIQQCVQPWDVKNSLVEKYFINDDSAVYQFSVIYSKDHSRAEIVGVGGVLDAVNISKKDGSKTLFQNKVDQLEIFRNKNRKFIYIKGKVAHAKLIGLDKSGSL